jgi:hypothetical protein
MSPGPTRLHGLLASYLAVEAQDGKQKLAAWKATWPSTSDFESVLPILWDAELRELLPPACQDLVQNQTKKLDDDFKVAAKSFPQVSYDNFRYFWLVVNTRSFYYDEPGTRWRNRDDKMCLTAVADLFNHLETGVTHTVPFRCLRLNSNTHSDSAL